MFEKSIKDGKASTYDNINKFTRRHAGSSSTTGVSVLVFNREQVLQKEEMFLKVL